MKAPRHDSLAGARSTARRLGQASPGPIPTSSFEARSVPALETQQPKGAVQSSRGPE